MTRIAASTSIAVSIHVQLFHKLRTPAFLVMAALGLLLFEAKPGIAAESFAAHAPLLSCSGLPCAMLQTEDAAPLKFLIDTGNAQSLIDLTVARNLHLPLQPVLNANKQPVPGYFKAVLKGASLGGASLGDLRVLAMDLRSQIAKGEMPDAAGVLSYVSLKDRVVTLDYRNREIAISSVGQSQPPPAHYGVLSFPTFGEHGPPIVATTGFQVNKLPVVVQVDTLFTGTTLIYPTAVGKLGLNAQAASRQVRRFPFTDGGVDMIEGRLQTQGFAGSRMLENGPVYFATPSVHLPDGKFDGTVGAGLLDGHAVTFDFVNNRFWVS